MITVTALITKCLRMVNAPKTVEGEKFSCVVLAEGNSRDHAALSGDFTIHL